MMRPDQNFTIRAAQVASAAPREWAMFVEAFKEYSAAEAALCVQAAPDALQRMQGRAQQCASLSTLFADPVNAASRVEKALAGKAK